MKRNVIDRFYIPGTGHSPLSNFYVGEPLLMQPYGWSGYDCMPSPEWPTSEHWYQAAKFTDPRDVEYVWAAATPGDAKRRGREHLKSFRHDWEARMIDAMRTVLAVKFAPGREEADYLLGTGSALLVEGNSWGDRVWGAEKDKEGEYTLGKNWLGWLLMSQRGYLQSLPPPGLFD